MFHFLFSLIAVTSMHLPAIQHLLGVLEVYSNCFNIIFCIWTSHRFFNGLSVGFLLLYLPIFIDHSLLVFQYEFVVVHKPTRLVYWPGSGLDWIWDASCFLSDTLSKYIPNQYRPTSHVISVEVGLSLLAKANLTYASLSLR
ncbi:hypothetical protein BJY01DRAFT_19448 [Aspergillus pseudoustus]|uniref:Uncharacterized protein n=1 Tax=Aspergillus pseudoustus TaxID=1810923 RepID=A0ABR4KRS8_9EURO